MRHDFTADERRRTRSDQGDAEVITAAYDEAHARNTYDAARATLNELLAQYNDCR